VTDIDYADDAATMDSSQAVLADIIQRMLGTCSALGLHISWTKTKVHNIGAGSPVTDIIVGNKTVQGVQDFVYLGSQISSANGLRTEQQKRIGIASGTMQRLHHVWCQCHLTLSTKLYLGPASPTIRLRNLDVNKTGPSPPTGLSHEIPKKNPGCALAEPC